MSRTDCRIGAMSLLAVATACSVAVGQSRPADGNWWRCEGTYRSHVEPIEGGRIDWTAGVLVVEGRGRAKAGTAQQRLMAARAAEVVAARNAVAMACGIQIDDEGRVRGIRDGRIYVNGVVRQHEIVRGVWDTSTTPPEYRVEMHVPLWGVEGVASLFWRTRQVQSRYGSTQRIALTQSGELDPQCVVVVDARGLAVSECLFPAIADTDGRILYDLATLSIEVARSRPVARYVELAEDADTKETGSMAPASSAKSEAERPNRMVVRAVGVRGTGHTDLAVRTADADRLARSPEAAAALRHARVLILIGPGTAAGSR